MRRTLRLDSRRAASRRGVTLVEMLVTVAILVIIMTVLVQVFQSATGAVSAAQAFQEIDDQLRRVDGLIRSDLGGVTARFTPPLDPADNLGYFEYGENEFADVQGEDSDDYIRFTAKAPSGRPFTGRMWIWTQAGNKTNLDAQPVTITSEYAEIIYFLRNGNLYRRVLLVAPDLQRAITQASNNQIAMPSGGLTYPFRPRALNGNPNQLFTTSSDAGTTSWQGVNDLSARPATTGNSGLPVQLNSLGSLTNRENRFASPRFADDFLTIVAGANGDPPTFNLGADGISDDRNSDNINDYYPSLFPQALAAAAGTSAQLIFEPGYPVARPQAGFAMAFPYIFPGAYSVPQAMTSGALGWIHAPGQFANVPSGGLASQAITFEDNPLAYLQCINHNPLDLGDNLPTPGSPAPGNVQGTALWQTWWGFPTWRETLSPSWNDPTLQVNVALAQPQGLSPRAANIPVSNDANLLPPMAQPQLSGPGGWPVGVSFSLIRRKSQLFSDGSGTIGLNSAFMGGSAVNELPLWSASWEDDLIMTNVRSFDVKAYDNSLASYADLGWGDDVRSLGWASGAFLNFIGVNAQNGPAAPFLSGNTDFSPLWTNGNPVFPPRVFIQNIEVKDYISQTFAHEGRMPPLVADNRLDFHYPNPTYVNATTFRQQYDDILDVPNNTYIFSNYSSNIGNDNDGVVRLRRVWDSWSSDYSYAPANGVYNNPLRPNNGPNPDPLNGSPWGPIIGTPPIYPSYPPPYPAPLRGIQIQIRVADPTNQRIKSLTIRQDFTDKL